MAILSARFETYLRHASVASLYGFVVAGIGVVLVFAFEHRSPVLAIIGEVIGFVGVAGSLAIIGVRLVLWLLWLGSKAKEFIQREQPG